MQLEQLQAFLAIAGALSKSSVKMWRGQSKISPHVAGYAENAYN